MDFQLIDTISHDNQPLRSVHLEGNILHTNWGSTEKEKRTKTIYERGRIKEINTCIYKSSNSVSYLISNTGFQLITPSTIEFKENRPKTIIKRSKIYERVGESGLKLVSSIQLKDGYKISQMFLEDDVLVSINYKVIGYIYRKPQYHHQITTLVKHLNKWKIYQSINLDNFGQMLSYNFVGQWLVVNTVKEKYGVQLHFYRLNYNEFKHKQTIQLDTVLSRRHTMIYPKIYLTHGVCVVVNDLLEIYHQKNNIWELVDLVDDFRSRYMKPIGALHSKKLHITPKTMLINVHQKAVDMYERNGDSWQKVFRLLDITGLRKEFLDFVKIKDDLLLIGESDKVSLYRMYYNE